MMMLAYNMPILLKFDSLHNSEYRQQIKTFRLMYVFLAAKIIKMPKCCTMKEIMLNLNWFSHNHHPSGVKMLVNFIPR
jgi:hypothetical protein